jgi:hypothetical protein
VHEQQASMKIFFDLVIWGGKEGVGHELGVVARCPARVGRNWELWRTPGRDGQIWLRKFGRHGFFSGPTGKCEISEISKKFCRIVFPRN